MILIFPNSIHVHIIWLLLLFLLPSIYSNKIFIKCSETFKIAFLTPAKLFQTKTCQFIGTASIFICFDLVKEKICNKQQSLCSWELQSRNTLKKMFKDICVCEIWENKQSSYYTVYNTNVEIKHKEYQVINMCICNMNQNLNNILIWNRSI